MNSNQPNQVTQAEIDWLVEGEMDSAERDELISKMENDENAWRRCALAYMERDALRRSLETTRFSTLEISGSEPDASTTEKKPADKVTTRSHVSSWENVRTLMPWSIAAALLFAFGFWFGNGFHQQIDNQAGVDGNHVPIIKNTIAQQFADQDPGILMEVSNAVNRLNVEDSHLIALVGVQQNAETRLLPVIESQILQQHYVELPQPALPRNFASKLNRAGWQFNHARQFLSLHLPNGQSQIMPVDMLNYRFVGQPTF